MLESVNADCLDERQLSGATPARFRLARWAPYLLAAVLFCLYGTWSISRHLRMETSGWDLGIFEQAVRGYAHFGAPVVPLKLAGYNLLGDHFHPILATIAPIYRLFPSPVTLLVVQAVLLAWSAVPVTRLAIIRFGAAGGVGVGVAYGLSWGIQSAVDFDFHEISFAVLFVSFSLAAIIESRWWHAAIWAAPLVLVKEDLPATVAVIGLVLFVRGQRRLGAGMAGYAIAVGVTILLLVIPAFNPQGTYAYTASTVPDGQSPVQRLLTPVDTKAMTLLLLLGATAFLAARSPLLLVAVPTLAWRFWSTNPLYWGTGFQYSAILMPVVFLAFLDAVPRLRVLRPGGGWLTAVAIYVPVMALVLTAVRPLPLRGLVETDTWQVSRSVTYAKQIAARIPDGATVAADNRLAPQLTSRCTVYLFPAYPREGIHPEWIVYTEPLDVSLAAQVTMVESITALSHNYDVVARNPGATLLHLR
ncbi:DUF2079 domain-containing protein [Micromonosporaceae bacterium Da 78-11]